jgi:glycosyltransferase involved in cell wall biosynthesis
MSKVLFLTDSLSNGGAERQLTLLTKNLPEEWDCRVWSLAGGLFADEMCKYGIQVEICSRHWKWDISPAVKLWQFVRLWRPDVIHSWGWMSTASAIPITKYYKIPFVSGIIRSGVPYYHRGRFSKFLTQWGDVVISNSKAGMINWGIDPSRVAVIYNGFDFERLSKCSSNKKIKEENEFTVVMAARMSIEKDY